jgi:hypothetical protein
MNEKHIEVKITTLKRKNYFSKGFEISRSEVNFGIQKGAYYSIIRVYGVFGESYIEEYNNPLNQVRLL